MWFYLLFYYNSDYIIRIEIKQAFFEKYSYYIHCVLVVGYNLKLIPKKPPVFDWRLFRYINLISSNCFLIFHFSPLKQATISVILSRSVKSTGLS